MTRQAWLGFGFLAPATLFVVAFFLAPVVMTGFFAFTNMSTATGITGGTYRITEGVISRLAGSEAVPATLIEVLGREQSVVDAAGLTALAEGDFDAAFVAELEEELGGRTFASQRDLEGAIRDLDNRPRRVRDIKAAAELFERSVLNVDFATEAAFTEAIRAYAGPVPDAAMSALTGAAYTGWSMTTDNFSRLFNSPELGTIAVNTVFYIFTTLALFNTGFALVLAITTFYLPGRQASFFRTVWLLPRISPPILYVLLWKWLAWDTGFLNAILEPLGVTGRNWMFDSEASAWTFVILINGFVGASMGMIILSSAIRAIPQPILYASAVDGAGRLQQIRHIILPHLRWPLLFITSYQTLSLLTSFEYILLSTDGGPGSTTEVWALAAYHTALRNYAGNLQYGYGAAMALVLVAFGIAMSFVYLRLFNFRTLVTRPRIEQ